MILMKIALKNLLKQKIYMVLDYQKVREKKPTKFLKELGLPHF